LRALLLTTLALVAFAANSIFCRLALAGGAIDAASFTTIRIVSGAAALQLILRPFPAVNPKEKRVLTHDL
jgi:hypothetical protein